VTRDIDFTASPEITDGVVTWKVKDLRIRISGVPNNLPPGQYSIEFIGATKKGINEPETFHYRFIGKEHHDA